MQLTKAEYLILTQLSKKSINALEKTHKKGGKPYVYNPRGNLLARLSKDLNMKKIDVYNILIGLRTKLHSSNRNS